MASRTATAENVSSTTLISAIDKADEKELSAEAVSSAMKDVVEETEVEEHSVSKSKKVVTKKKTAKKATTKKAAAKKTTIKKKVVKKTTTKKTTKKPTTKKTTAKKVTKVSTNTKSDGVEKTKARKAPTTIPDRGPARRFPLSVQLALAATIITMGASAFIGYRDTGSINVAQLIEAKRIQEAASAAFQSDNNEGDSNNDDVPVESNIPVAPPANNTAPNGGLRGSGSATPDQAVNFVNTTVAEPAPAEDIVAEDVAAESEDVDNSETEVSNDLTEEESAEVSDVEEESV